MCIHWPLSDHGRWQSGLHMHMGVCPSFVFRQPSQDAINASSVLTNAKIHVLRDQVTDVKSVWRRMGLTSMSNQTPNKTFCSPLFPQVPRNLIPKFYEDSSENDQLTISIIALNVQQQST